MAALRPAAEFPLTVSGLRYLCHMGNGAPFNSPHENDIWWEVLQIVQAPGATVESIKAEMRTKLAELQGSDELARRIYQEVLDRQHEPPALHPSGSILRAIGLK